MGFDPPNTGLPNGLLEFRVVLIWAGLNHYEPI
jgi:hypothetical protein